MCSQPKAAKRTCPESSKSDPVPKNTLNDLTGTEWIKRTKSWFVCDSPRYHRNRETELHPARFPEEMVAQFVTFFTKAGQWVFDPFCGSGATLVASLEQGRRAVGLELASRYAEVTRQRLAELAADGKAQVIEGDATGLLKPELWQDCIARSDGGLPQFDFIITSPPYWNMLRHSRGGVRSTHKQRAEAGLDTRYSDSRRDLGNIKDYDEFIEAVGDVFDQCQKLLKPEKYMVVVAQNLRVSEGYVRPLAWDLARRISASFSFQGERIWCQDSKQLGIWGYPKVFVPNYHHHYCLIFRNDSAPVLMKPSVALVSLGCARNLVDSEVMLGFLNEAGYPIVEDNEDAQVVIVNTCAFIEPAVDEAIEALLDVSELKKKGKLQALICAGCLPQRYQDDLLEQLPEVDVFLTPGAVDQIVEAVQVALSGQRAVMKAPLEYIYDAQTPRWRSAPSWLAYVKIAEGCDNRCAYCTIPALRGHHRSRLVDDICAEFSNLANDGAQEIVLIAHDTTRYGAEMEPPSSLAALLDSLPTRDYNGWIRIMYMYPTCITTNLINSIGQSICTVPYFDIPFQHASRDVLKRMGRAGDGEVYLNELARIRQIIPEAAIRTTLIAGLPGETDEDFELLLDFVREARFDRLGVFPYWPEPGTPAAEMEDQVPPEVARERQAELISVQEQISLENNQRFVGQRLRVLVERGIEEGVWASRSYRDAPEVDAEVILRPATEGIQPNLGEFVWATIEKAQVHDLEAILIN